MNVIQYFANAWTCACKPNLMNQMPRERNSLGLRILAKDFGVSAGLHRGRRHTNTGHVRAQGMDTLQRCHQRQ